MASRIKPIMSKHQLTLRFYLSAQKALTFTNFSGTQPNRHKLFKPSLESGANFDSSELLNSRIKTHSEALGGEGRN